MQHVSASFRQHILHPAKENQTVLPLAKKPVTRLQILHAGGKLPVLTVFKVNGVTTSASGPCVSVQYVLGHALRVNKTYLTGHISNDCQLAQCS